MNWNRFWSFGAVSPDLRVSHEVCTTYEINLLLLLFHSRRRLSSNHYRSAQIYLFTVNTSE